MYILVVDNEHFDLKKLEEEVKCLFPLAHIQGIQSATEALEWVEKLYIDGKELSGVFLETCFQEMNGLDLARKIREIFPKAAIIFCTSHQEYAYEAFQLFAKGYLMKPVAAEDIKNMLDEMIPYWQTSLMEAIKDIRIHTFGHFEVTVNGKPLAFKREKAKELLAYLVDRHGASITTEQIALTLWENAVYDRKLKNMTTAVISSLRTTLREAGIEDILIKSWNHLAIDVNIIKCDAYEFEKGNSIARKNFHGEYMSNYSWAEFSTGKYII